MVTNMLAYSGLLLCPVLSVLLPHLEPHGSFERYLDKVFSLQSVWKTIVESSKAEP